MDGCLLAYVLDVVFLDTGVKPLKGFLLGEDGFNLLVDLEKAVLIFVDTLLHVGVHRMQLVLHLLKHLSFLLAFFRLSLVALMLRDGPAFAT